MAFGDLTESAGFVPAPEGVFTAHLLRAIDQGTQKSTFNGGFVSKICG
jgi:hypothetical protein